VASGGAGLRIIDVANPAEPVEVGAYTDRFGRSVQVAGDFAYLASERGGVAVLDVANHSAPRLVSSFDTRGSADGVWAAAGSFYVADSVGGLLVLSPAPGTTAQIDSGPDALADGQAPGTASPRS
jgi:hypothetical protein